MTIQRILLDSERFTQCLHQYIEDEKPDPIQKKQLESWTVAWTNDENDDDDQSMNGLKSLPDDSDAGIIPMNFTPTHVVSGTLQISTEYMILVLSTKCIWMGDIMNGSIRFTCHVSARTNVTTDGVEATTTTKKKKMKNDSTRITTTMIDRLCRDEYIRKILLSTDTESGTDDTNHTKNKRYLLCSASMDTKKSTTDNALNENEERVYCDEMIAEATRRIIYSSSDSVLDIVDILFRLPYLPCTSGSSNTNNGNDDNGDDNGDDNDTATTKLADRVRLRLLEEATYDVCDNEPDDEIVDDLSIKDNNNDNDNDNNNDNGDGTNDEKNNKISRKHKKVKR